MPPRPLAARGEGGVERSVELLDDRLYLDSGKTTCVFYLGAELNAAGFLNSERSQKLGVRGSNPSDVKNPSP